MKLENIYVYPAIFLKEQESGFSVLFPDFETSTCGEDIVEAMLMAEELLGVMIEYYQDKKLELPSPSKFKSIELTSPNEFVNFIKVDLDDYKRKMAENEADENNNK